MTLSPHKGKNLAKFALAEWSISWEGENLEKQCRHFPLY